MRRGNKRKAKEAAAAAAAAKKPATEAANCKQSAAAAATSSSSGSGFYNDRIAALQQEEETIREGSHPDLQRRLKELERLRERRLRDASLYRELRIEEVEGLFKFENKAALDTFETAKKNLIERMIAEVAEATKNLEDLRDGVAEELRSTTRKLRSKAKPGDEAHELFDEPRPSRSKKSHGDDWMPLDLKLGDSDAIEDLKLIHKDWCKMAAKFHSAREINEISVRTERGRLMYNELVLERGADVIVTTEPNKEEYYGQITSVTDTEVFVKLVDGSKSRVPLAHLRSKRCVVKRQ